MDDHNTSAHPTVMTCGWMIGPGRYAADQNAVTRHPGSMKARHDILRHRN